MNHPDRCEKCGTPLPQDGSLSGRCLRCLLEAGLDSTGVTEHPATTGAAKSADFLPSRIARYNVTRLIGQGGMGAVYEAEQEHPRRTVALKIIKPGMASPELLRRFEQETQALGRLQHPGIAQIYEAGTADTGFGPQPYFAMEYIRGRSLVKYADELKLDTRARLEIMARVGDAIQHAHQRGLIHRDLKPGNILVDESGQPKIVDFGVARLTDHDTQAATQSGAGQLIGTLAYMSPEQVLADPLEIDTRSDVYALGVILYELLAGRLPYNTSNNLHEALSAIREEDPARLSSVDHGYRGDIETIVAKALEKDKSRRYDSAAEMAADIRRYLTDDPILARPPSVGYQLQKFTRRHKALVAGAAAVFVVLVAGIVASTLQAARARRAELTAVAERDRAKVAEETVHGLFQIASANSKLATKERDRAIAAEAQTQQERDAAIVEKQRADAEADTAKALNQFLGIDLLNIQAVNQSDRAFMSARSSPNITMREALDRAVPRITGKFDSKPLVEADLRETIATAYNSLNAFAEMQKQLERVVELRKRAQGSRHPDTLRSIYKLAWAFSKQSMFVEAANQYKAVVKEKPYSDDFSVMLLLEAYDKGNLRGDAESFLLGLLEEDRRRGAWDDMTANFHIASLMGLYRTWAPGPKYAEAEVFLKKVLEHQKRTVGADNKAIRVTVDRLARVYAAQAKLREAEEILTPLIPVVPVAALGQYPTLLDSMALLMEVYGKLGKSSQADALQKNVSNLAGAPIAAPLGKTVATPLSSATVKAREYLEAGKDAEADELIPGVLEGFRRAVGQKDSSSVAITLELNSLVELYVKQGKPARAQQLFREIMDIRLSTQSDEDVAAASVVGFHEVSVFKALGVRDSFEKNEQLLEQLLRIQRRLLGVSSSSETIWGLSQVYWDHAKFDQAQGRVQQAQGNYEKADELISELVKVFRGISAQQAMINVSRQAQVRASLGKYEEAEALFSEVLAYRRGNPNEVRNLPMILAELGWARIHQSKYSEAEVVLREGCGRFEAGAELRYNCDSLLGASLVGQAKFADAEPLLLSGYDGLIHAVVDERPTTNAGSRLVTARFFTQDVGGWIVRLYEEWGKLEQAAEWKKKLEAAKSRVN